MLAGEELKKTVELAQKLARFKLQVRRKVNQSVDLDRLKNDKEYARTRLAELEEIAEDEELLVAIVMMRELLLPPQKEETRHAPSKYRFGPRG